MEMVLPRLKQANNHKVCPPAQSDPLWLWLPQKRCFLFELNQEQCRQREMLCPRLWACLWEQCHYNACLEYSIMLLTSSYSAQLAMRIFFKLFRFFFLIYPWSFHVCVIYCYWIKWPSLRCSAAQVLLLYPLTFLPQVAVSVIRSDKTQHKTIAISQFWSLDYEGTMYRYIMWSRHHLRQFTTINTTF